MSSFVDAGAEVGGNIKGTDGTVVGDDIRGVQVADGFKHTVDVCVDGDKTEEADNGTTGTVVGGDIRGVQLAGGCKHTVDVCDDGQNLGEWLEWRTETISVVFSSQDVVNTLWGVATMGTKPTEWVMGQLDRWGRR